MKKVLVYPCGTEIGLEIYRSLRYSTHYALYGGSSGEDRARFVYPDRIADLPFLTDRSAPEEVQAFDRAIAPYGFDFVYPAMDGVVTLLARYRCFLKPLLLAPDAETAIVTRSKRKTYSALSDVIPVPRLYADPEEIERFPVFVKPDVGQGSAGARRIASRAELEGLNWTRNLCMELLPGREYTVDCFTNGEGNVLYANGRCRNAVRGGISISGAFVENPLFRDYAEAINQVLPQRGGWFFQLKEAEDGTLKLLEVASRIAGTSALSRVLGVNLPLLTVSLFDGFPIDSVLPNVCQMELDRTLRNLYRTDVRYRTAYVDFDDTVTLRGNVNLQVIQFLYQCVNRGIRLILLSKHDGDLDAELRRLRLAGLFDEVIHLERGEEKWKRVTEPESILIDDSYGERRAVKERRGIPVFDTHMIECLLEEA